MGTAVPSEARARAQQPGNPVAVTDKGAAAMTNLNRNYDNQARDKPQRYSEFGDQCQRGMPDWMGIPFLQLQDPAAICASSPNDARSYLDPVLPKGKKCEALIQGAIQ